MNNKTILMKAIVTCRVMQLYYHNCHNLVSGETFFSDHSFFGDLYPRLESDYDRLAEFYIATFGKAAFETKALSTLVQEELDKFEVEKMSCKDMFSTSVELETKLYKELEAIDKKASIGLRNLIGDVAEQIDVRMYKLKQRLDEKED